jgi:hypothetical protein
MFLLLIFILFTLTNGDFLSQEKCNTITNLEKIDSGTQKQVYSGIYNSKQIIIKTMIGPMENIFKEYLYMKSVGDLNVYGLCMYEKNIFLLMDRYEVLKDYGDKSYWLDLFDRLANFHGGPLQMDDFAIQNFGFYNNQIHILDYDNVFVSSSKTDSYSKNLHLYTDKTMANDSSK